MWIFRNERLDLSTKDRACGLPDSLVKSSLLVFFSFLAQAVFTPLAAVAVSLIDIFIE